MTTLRTVLPAATLLLTIAAAADDSSWTLASGTDPASYQTVSTLSQEASATISDEYGMKEVRPRLEFRCAPAGETAITVRIDWRRFISSFNTEVTFTPDAGEPLVVKLAVDRSNKITATRNSADDQALISYLADHKSLTVGVIPYSEAPVSVSFDLNGLADGLQRLQASCKP